MPPDSLTGAIGRTTRSAVWRLTFAFAALLILGAAVFVAGAYVLLVRADTEALQGAVLVDAKDLHNTICGSLAEAITDCPPRTMATPAGAGATPMGVQMNLIASKVADEASERDKGMLIATFYRYDPPRSGRPEGDTRFPEPVRTWCAWWSLGGLRQCLGFGRPARDDRWYYVEAPGEEAAWGLARRLDMASARPGDNGYFYVGRQFAMSAVEGEMVRLAIGTLGGASLVALVIGFLASRRMLRRVEAVNAICDRVDRGDSTARVSDADASDEFGELARHVNGMHDRINRHVGDLREFSNFIAHELRRPIARLMADLERVAGATDLEAAQGGAEAAAGETDRILATFQALLDIARVEVGASVKARPMRLDDAVREAVDLYAAVAEEAGVRMVLQAEPAPMTGDPVLIEQLAVNLVNNAIKFSPTGGEIRVSVERRGGEVRLRVRDQGPGIPAEEREAVTGRFFRGVAGRAKPGHGLGLAMVQAIAKQHEAAIRMDDARPGLDISLAFKAT